MIYSQSSFGALDQGTQPGECVTHSLLNIIQFHLSRRLASRVVRALASHAPDPGSSLGQDRFFVVFAKHPYQFQVYQVV